MRIALDATYSFGDALSGVGVYSREILYGLAASNLAERWEWFYRSHRYWKALRLGKPANVRTRLLTETWGSRSADLFHGLNQRLPRRRFRRNIATFHDLFVLSGEYSTPEFRTRFAGQARDASDRADLIIAVSEFTALQVEAFLNVPRSRIRVVHHGVIPRSLPDLPRENVVLCVGAIQKRKNQAGLVRAFAALPREWTLVLAGSEGFGASETAEAIAASPARDRIRVTGYLSESELAGWYARASIFAFPSFDEGFGMPVLEAMAAGLPVIASNCSALPEVAGDAALLIDPNRDEQLVAALSLLAADPQKRLALAEKGQERARAFTWARAVTETARIYRELL
ncbi:MAG TPA: glycosyltransferase family 1 protein [Bryobacteraceae bacterium]|nr:glycosyltransferase family 1 protein [Bryobacteraceae bacterium]